jgi:hypothetical protein
MTTVEMADWETEYTLAALDKYHPEFDDGPSKTIVTLSFDRTPYTPVEGNDG